MKASTLTLPDTEDKLDAFLQFNEREVLSCDCELRADAAEAMVLERYESFDAAGRETARLAADKADIAQLREVEKEAAKKRRKKRDQDA